jgi:hypothetical protein
MRDLSVKNIIDFARKSDRSKKSFAENFKIDAKQKLDEGGGDYWITSISAISNSFKTDDLGFIIEKRYELEEKFKITEFDNTKAMYKRNIAILYNYENFDLKKWRPSKKITFIKKHLGDSVMTIRGLNIKVSPHHIFTFKLNDIDQIGAIWFVAKLGGYSSAELGMFTDILYRNLRNNFAKDFELNPKYCIAVDVVNNFEVSYLQIQEAEIPSVLIKTINEINKLM